MVFLGLAPQTVFAVGVVPRKYIEWKLKWNGAPKTVQFILLDEEGDLDYTKGLKKAFGQFKGKTKLLSSYHVQSHRIPFLSQLGEALGSIDKSMPSSADLEWMIGLRERTKGLFPMSKQKLREVNKAYFLELEKQWGELERDGEFSLSSVTEEADEESQEAGSKWEEYLKKWKLPKISLWRQTILRFRATYLEMKQSGEAIHPTPEQKRLPVDLFYTSVMSQQEKPKQIKEMNEKCDLLFRLFFAHVMFRDYFRILSTALDSVESHDRLIFVSNKALEENEAAFPLVRILKEILGGVDKDLKQTTYSGNPIQPKELFLLLSGMYSAGCRGCAREGKTTRNIKLKPCSGCLRAAYCSEECYKRDWPKHQLENKKSHADWRKAQAQQEQGQKAESTAASGEKSQSLRRRSYGATETKPAQSSSADDADDLD